MRKKTIKTRTDWKKTYEKEVEKHETTKWNLDAAHHNNEVDKKAYNKQLNDVRKTKNFWIWTMSIISLLLLVSLGIAQNRLSQEEQFNYLITVAGVNANMELDACQKSLKDITQKYNDNFYEVVSNKPMSGVFDCCWPSDCAEAINNPATCNCEYMVECSGWN